MQINAINAATEAACLILSVDETIKNPKVSLFLSLYELRIFSYVLKLSPGDGLLGFEERNSEGGNREEIS